MRLTFLRYLLVIALAMTAACSNLLRSDEAAGEELYAHSEEPLRFITPRTRLSAVGKDYLFMAPVTVSRNRQSQVYLWFALGSTIDRPITGAPEPTFSTIVIDLDGMLMTFDIIPWANVSSVDPFALSVNPRATYGAKVTDSQLGRIAGAQYIRAFVTNAQDRSPVYERVHNGGMVRNRR